MPLTRAFRGWVTGASAKARAFAVWTTQPWTPPPPITPSGDVKRIFYYEAGTILFFYPDETNPQFYPAQQTVFSYEE
jgi:hypothetical protein